MAANTLPIAIGTASARAEHAADVGKEYFQNGILYRIVKASATIATAAKKVVVDTLTLGVPQNSIATTVTVGDYLIAGVVPTGQTGSTGTTSLISGDYFPLIVGGKGIPCITDDTTVVAGSIVATSTAVGKVALVVSSLASLTGVRLGTATLAATASSAIIYVNIDRLL